MYKLALSLMIICMRMLVDREEISIILCFRPLSQRRRC